VETNELPAANMSTVQGNGTLAEHQSCKLGQEALPVSEGASADQSASVTNNVPYLHNVPDFTKQSGCQDATLERVRKTSCTWLTRTMEASESSGGLAVETNELPAANMSAVQGDGTLAEHQSGEVHAIKKREPLTVNTTQGDRMLVRQQVQKYGEASDDNNTLEVVRKSSCSWLTRSMQDASPVMAADAANHRSVQLVDVTPRLNRC